MKPFRAKFFAPFAPLRQALPLLLALTGGLATAGCAGLVADRLAEPLTASLEQQSDLELLRAGTPSLLLTLDGLVVADPGNNELLIAACKAYSGYAALVDAEGKADRARELSRRAWEYGRTLLARLPAGAATLAAPLPEVPRALAACTVADVPALFWGGYAWAASIRQAQGAPAAMLELPRVEQIMLRVVELDEGYHFGAAHVVLGTYYGSRPAMYGGEPAKSRQHFEQALRLAHRRFLPAQVAYAEVYARQAFDRELFRQLLKEVAAAPADAVPALTATNTMAKERAAKLLGRIDELF